jgi:hypothetical protein
MVSVSGGDGLGLHELSSGVSVRLEAFTPRVIFEDMSKKRVPFSGPGHFLPLRRHSEHSGKVSSHCVSVRTERIWSQNYISKSTYLDSALHTHFAASASPDMTAHRRKLRTNWVACAEDARGCREVFHMRRGVAIWDLRKLRDIYVRTNIPQ